MSVQPWQPLPRYILAPFEGNTQARFCPLNFVKKNFLKKVYQKRICIEIYIHRCQIIYGAFPHLVIRIMSQPLESLSGTCHVVIH